MTAAPGGTLAEPSPLTVRVESFEGPLDLLLHLCRTNELDLTALSVRSITDQYLAYLESVEFRDLEVSGAFLVMAATLIYLKSKLLLPTPEEPEAALDEEGELLRQELALRLAEYARVKALGTWLGEREAEQARLWGRPGSELPPPEDIPLSDLSVDLLSRALQRLIAEQERRRPHGAPEAEPITVLQRMDEIVSLLRHTWSLLFSTVAGDRAVRAEWVVTLLALLELVRLGQARARQAELFGDITIERHAVSVTEPAHGPAGSERADV